MSHMPMKRMTRPNLFAFIISILGFAPLYVSSTMNAIGEDYQVGIESFKTLFRLIGLGVLIVSVAGIVAGFANKALANYLSRYLISSGKGLIAVSFIVFGLGYAPCLAPHPTTEPHQTHHYLGAVFERSLLCPRYSNRSYPGIFLYSALGVLLVVSGARRVSEDA